jgi:hypothetical protein
MCDCYDEEFEEVALEAEEKDPVPLVQIVRVAKSKRK